MYIHDKAMRRGSWVVRRHRTASFLRWIVGFTVLCGIVPELRILDWTFCGAGYTRQGTPGLQRTWRRHSWLAAVAAPATETSAADAKRSANGNSSVKEALDDIVAQYASNGDLSFVQDSFKEMLKQGVSLHPSAYRQPLKVCADAGRPEDATAWMAFMADSKVEPDASAYDCLIKSHLKQGDTEQAMRSLFDAGKPLVKTCREVLNGLVEAKDLPGATRLMSCLPALGVQPTYPMYKNLVRVAAMVGNIEMAEAWHQQLKEDGFKPDEGLYVLLIQACQQAKDPEKAVAYFNLMVTADVKPTRGAFIHVILTLAKAKDVDVLSEWMERMMEAGFEPTNECYEAVLEASAARKDYATQDFWENSLLEPTPGKKAKKPDREVYKVLIRVPARYGDVKRSSRWLREMQQAHREPGTNEWNYVLRACETAKDADSAQKFINRMLSMEKGAKPDAESYNLVIKTLAKAGKPKLAARWGTLMADAGFSARGIQFNEVIKATARGATISADYAAEWVQRALEAGQSPALEAYKAVIRAYLDEKNDAQARQWLQWMTGNGTKADEGVYLMFLRTDGQEVGAWLEQMEDSGVVPSVEAYNSVIRYYASFGNETGIEAAEEWYNRMSSAGIAANEDTFTHLITANSRAGKKDEASQWLSKLTGAGFRPHLGAYTALMQGYLKAGDVSGVQQILDWLVLEGLKPHRGAYNIAIRAFSKAGDAKSAEQMYKRLTVAGRSPDEKTFRFLIECHTRLGDFDRARAWFREMLKMEVRPTFPIYAAMIRGAAVAQRPKETEEFLQELKIRKYHAVERSAWEAMMVPAVRCFQKAGDDEAAARWVEYSEDRGFPELDLESKEMPEWKPFKPKSSKVVKKAREAPDVESEMRALDAMMAEGKKPTIHDFNKVMKAFALSPQPRFSMARTFLTNTIVPAAEPNEITWTLLLRCNRDGDGKRGLFTLESMAEQKVQLSRRHISLVLRQLFRDLRSQKITTIEPLLEKLLALLAPMKNAKKISDTYNRIVWEMAEADQPEMAKQWVERLRADGYELKAVQAAKLAQAHFKKGDEVSALSWIQRGLPSGTSLKQGLGLFVDTVTAKGRKAGTGVVVKSSRPNFGFIKMEEPPFQLYFRRKGTVGFDGMPPIGTRVRYDVVLDGDGRQRATNVASADSPPQPGIVDRLAAWLQRLSVSQIPEEDVPYLEVIFAYARDGNPTGAARWFDNMVAAGQQPPLEAYNAVIRSYGTAGDAEEAARWLARLRLAEMDPDLDSYKAVLTSWAAAGKTERVLEFWQELTDSDSGVTPDDDCYCSVLRALCASGDDSGVKSWLDRFEWEGISLNWEAYSDLVRFYTSRGELDKAFELSEEIANGDAFETGPGAWLRQLQAAADKSDAGHAEKVARAMHRHCGSLGKVGTGLVQKTLSEDRIQALSKDIEELRAAAPGLEG